MTPTDRFLSRIKKGPGCWTTSYSTDKDGYGQVKVRGKNLRTHRFAFEIFKGPIPDGMCVCHACDNPGCVNPEHLWLGTNLENIADKNIKGRNVTPGGERHWTKFQPHRLARGDRHGSKTMPGRVIRGERIRGAKLNEEKVRMIRSANPSRGYVSRLARELGVSGPTVCDVLSRRTWDHV